MFFKSNGQKTIQEELLLMRRDNKNSEIYFQPSKYWTIICKEFDRILSKNGLSRENLGRFNMMFSQSDINSPRYYRYALWMLYKEIKKKDRYNFLDKVSGIELNKDSICVFENRKITWDLLISIDTVYNIAEIYSEILTESLVIADLGAGWGRIGYVLKKINPKITYIDFDLPEPLLVASACLNKHLPNEKVLSYKSLHSISKLSKKCFRNLV